MKIQQATHLCVFSIRIFYCCEIILKELRWCMLLHKVNIAYTTAAAFFKWSYHQAEGYRISSECPNGNHFNGDMRGHPKHSRQLLFQKAYFTRMCAHMQTCGVYPHQKLIASAGHGQKRPTKSQWHLHEIPAQGRGTQADTWGLPGLSVYSTSPARSRPMRVPDS